MNKEEQLKIYSAYLPYDLQFISNDVALLENAWTMIGIKSEEKIYGFSDTILSKRSDYKNIINISAKTIKPILYDLSYLTKEELIEAGFSDHIDYLTREREGWINKYGFEIYINMLPYGHFQYLVSKHYNVFNLPEYINKATLTTNK